MNYFLIGVIGIVVLVAGGLFFLIVASAYAERLWVKTGPSLRRGLAYTKRFLRKESV